MPLGSSAIAPRLAADGAGGILVGWLDGGRLRVQRLGADGAPAWSVLGGTLVGAGVRADVVGDGAGGAFLVAEEAGPACCGVTVEHLDGLGVSGGARHLAPAAGAVAGSLAAVSDDAGGVRVAFATPDGGIVLHELDADGNPRAVAVLVARATPAGALALIADGGDVVLAWAERDGTAVRAQRVDARGALSWSADGVEVTGSALGASEVGLAVDGLGRVTVTWQEARDASAACPDNCVPRTQRLAGDGRREWEGDGRALGALPAFGPRVTAAGDGIAGAWQHCSATACAGASEVHVQVVPGVASVSVGEAPVDSRAALIADGAGGVIVAWWQCAAGCEVRTRRVALDALKTAAAPLAGGADLVLTTLSAPAAQAAPGQTVLIGNTARNAGGATSVVPFRVGFYLSSTNASVSSPPIGFRTVPTLVAGAQSAGSTAVTIPSDTPAGPIFLVAVVDDLEEVLEDNDANNVRSIPLTIVKPDLVVSAVTAPATGIIGGTLAVGTTVRNLTTGMVSATFTVGIYLAANASVDPTVDRRVGSRTIAGLAASGTSAASTTVSVPSDLVPGSYFVGAVADVDGVVPEGNVSNNSRVAAARTAFKVAITSFTPALGPVATPVTITGASLPAVQEVRFGGGANVSSFTRLSPTTLRTTVPAGAVTGPITFVFVGGNVSSTTPFKVTPTIASFTPATALMGANVGVSGTTLAGASAKIGAVVAPVVSSSDTTLVLTVPGTARTGRISVTNAGGIATAATDLIVVRPPTITSFSPAAAAVGATVTIAGTDLAATTDVAFNGVSAGAPTIVSASAVRAVVPAGATTGKISVTNAAGTTQSVGVFRVAPRVLGFTPALGLPGANVSITGTTLAGAAIVRFGSVAAAIVSSSAGEIVAGVPPTAASGRITVVTPDGQSVSPADFLVIKPPTISSLSPAAAAVGASVIVNGTNLASASAVRFNGVPVDRRVVLSNTMLRVTVPLGATTGTASVTNGAGSANSAAVFKVLPAIVDVSPSSGFVGTTVTITGTTFTGLVSLRFGAAAAGVVSATDSEVVVTVPAGATSGPVALTTGAGTAASATPFEVIRPPTVTSFTPTAAPAGTDVTIDGDSVGSATVVTFNGLDASAVSRVSSSRIKARVPLLATTGSISITNPAGSVVTAAIFRVTPKISGFDPSIGAAGTSVTISGSGFVGTPTVRFGGMVGSSTPVSLTSVVALVPPGAPTGFVTVTTTEGVGNSSTKFTVIVAPTLTTFTPASGAAGTAVLLSGTNLTSTSTVRFNGVNASTMSPNVSVTTALRATVPMGATTGRITVVNAAGTVTSASDFHVLPTITGFTPDEGAAGTLVTITGNALNGATGVRFGAADATLVGGNATQVVAIVPGTATTGPITVITPEGSTASADAFDVLGPMELASAARRARLFR